MKNTFFLLFLLYAFSGCNDHHLTHQETVTKYYEARDAVNFTEVEKYVNDSITITAGDYVMPYSHDSFYEVFKWDSIFQPSYEIVSIKEKNNQVIAAVTLNSIRNDFLKNSSMTCEYKISFVAGKISTIESLDCKDVDWILWQEGVASLVSWIQINHPQLDGFINDMTMNGALNYLKAIELYNAAL